MATQTLDKIVWERRLQILETSLGADIMHYMHQDDVTEVMVNPDGKLWIDRFGVGFEDTGIRMDPDKTKRVIYAIADLSGNTINLKVDPSLQADIPASRLFSNCRFQAELPGLVDAPSFNIRKHSKSVYTLADYVTQGSMTKSQHDAIIAAIHNHRNVIAAGGTASGKTTLLNAILAEISTLGERIITIEDTKELKCTAENSVALTTMENVDMDALLKKILRLSPNRIVVGEVRSKEALTLIDAWSTGHRGGCSTVHSDSALETLFRLEGMISRVSITPQQASIARAINVIVYIAKRAAVRRVEEVIAVDTWDAGKGEYIVHRLDDPKEMKY